MNVGIFTDTYTPIINGVVTSVVQLEKELIKHNHNVFIITSSSYHKVVRVNNVIRIPGINLKKLYNNNVSGIYSLIGAKYISDLELDVVHAQTEYGIGIFARIIAAQFNIPLIYTYHTMMEDYTHYVTKYLTRYSTRPIKHFMKSASRIYANHCSELIVPSKKTAKAMIKYGVTKEINIIPSGIDLSRFDKSNICLNTINTLKEKYDISDDHYIFINVGRIAPEKNIDMIINAFKLIHQEFINNYKFLIVGAGPSIDDLKEMVNEYQLNNNIIFIGEVKNDLIPLYYHLADVFLATSTSETQGLTYIEAMASGLPVICKYDENLKDLVIDNHNGFVINDVQELSACIKKFINMKDDEYKLLSTTAIKSVNKYSADIFYEKIIAVYQKAIKENSQNDKDIKYPGGIRTLSSFFR
ncbi:MAG: glycosyltransferase [Bacilli bacterium]|jgi:1,2-diacylglycerol 3-alpha-glucosyltransferase|nr:glycosyltransferase [Bacilli bacterium]